MASTTGKSQCVTCRKEGSVVRCEGCFELLCFDDLNDRRQELGQTFDEIEQGRDAFRQTLNEQMHDPKQHHSIKQIDQWESNSIAMIQQTAQQCREKVFEHITEYFEDLEVSLMELTEQMQDSRQNNDFNENDLNQLKEKLTQLEKEMDHIPTLSIQEDSNSFIKKMTVVSLDKAIGKEKILLKIILIGDSTVGKSSIIKQYISRKSSNEYNLTIGADLLFKEIPIDNHLVKLAIWDTCGNESYRDITATYYRETDGCLLVYDVTSARSFQSVDTWREHFLTRGKPPNPESFPFVVIGTNADREGRREIQAHTARSWCKDNLNIPYFETSSKENLNLDRAFKTLARNALTRRQNLDQTTKPAQPKKIPGKKQSSNSKRCHVS